MLTHEEMTADISGEAGWQPIETAPRDGSWILLSGGTCKGDEDYQKRIVTGQYTNELNGGKTDWHWQFAWFDGGYYGQYDNPSHWQPLPASPVEGMKP